MKICFLGIGGVSMAKLAAYLKSIGFYVFGQDKFESEATLELKKIGVSVFIGENFIGVKSADIVVYSSAVSENSYELSVCEKLKIPVLKRAELLGKVLKKFDNSIGVAGSHGKTTVTKMIKTVFDAANVNCFEHIGAFEGAFQPQFTKTPKYAVSEVCEYKKNIAYINVKTAVLLNVDNDHLDCYGTIDKLKEEFFAYLNRSKIKIINIDDKNSIDYLRSVCGKETYTYGVSEKADYRAENLAESGGAYSFAVLKRGEVFLKIKLRVLGLHNVYNALAAVAALDLNGIDGLKIKEGVENYSGATRRFEALGEFNGVRIIADYAHHPSEIKAVLKTMKEVYGDDYVVVFQPHTYSRTKILFDDFCGVLESEKLAVYKTYPARESYDVSGDGVRLSKALNAEYITSIDKVFDFISSSNKKAAIIMGAGDLYYGVKTPLNKNS